MLALSMPGETMGQTVCRPNELGGQTCLHNEASRPMARPENLFPDKHLGDLLGTGLSRQSGPTIVPSRKVDRLGKTFTDQRIGGSGGRCRTDTLGNLVCR